MNFLSRGIGSLLAVLVLSAALMMPSHPATAALIIIEGESIQYDDLVDLEDGTGDQVVLHIGDKSFTDIVLESGTGINADAVIFEAILDGAGNPAIQLSSIPFSVAPGEEEDLSLFYTVFVDANGDGINDGTELIIGLSGTIDGGGDVGFIIVSEKALDDGGIEVGDITQTINLDEQDPPFEGFDMDLQGAFDILFISKDIGGESPRCLRSDGSGFFTDDQFTPCDEIDESLTTNLSGISLSIITQNFKQIPRIVPEPASLGLFGFGLIGLGYFLRRRRKIAA